MPVSSLASLFLRSRRGKPARALRRERSSLPPLRKCCWVVRYSPREEMQGAINERCWANMGEDGMQTRDHSQRFAFLNLLIDPPEDYIGRRFEDRNLPTAMDPGFGR